MRKTILYGLGVIMLGLFLLPSAMAEVVKLGNVARDNLGINMKGMSSRTTAPGRLECVRAKDCSTDGSKYCSGNKCQACTYGCPSGLSVSSTGKCGSVATSVTGIKVNPACADKSRTCYTAGSDCGSGQVCSGNACISCTYTCPSGTYGASTGKCGSVASSVAGVKNNSACPNMNLTCYSAGADCTSGSVCSGNSCATCSYSCPSGLYETSPGKCGSLANTVNAVKSNGSCPDQSKTCYSAGVSCPSGQSCSDNVCKNLDTCEKTKATCAATIGGSEADWTVSGTGAACACTTNKRYVMTNDCTTFNGARVCRIKAVKDFANVKITYKTVTKEDCGNKHDDGSPHYVYGGDNSCYTCRNICASRPHSSGYCAHSYGGNCYECQSCWNSGLYSYKCTSYQVQEEASRTTLVSVKVGDIGGYIEKEANLSNYASATGWVGVNAKVYGSGSVSDAYVYGNAVVSGGSAGSGQIYDNAVMTGGSLYRGSIFGNARNNGCSVSDNAKLYGYAVIGTSKSSSYSCELHENVEVYGNAIINDDVRLWGNVKVYDNARIGAAGQIYIKGTTYIYGSARVYGHKNWTASPGYQHENLIGNNLYIGGSVRFCDNRRKSGTFTSGTVTGSWETSCNPPF